MRKRVVAIAAVLLLAAGCTGGSGSSPGPSATPAPEPWRGGTLRLGVVGSGAVGNISWYGLDPQQEYSLVGWELLRCCLVRTLFSYNGLPVSEGGAEARPDLAAGPAEVSPDGLTWTVRIKQDIHYAPPLEDVEINAQDFVRALMRMADPRVTPEACVGCFYPFYYSVVEGFDAYRDGAAETISGLETPDAHTLVIRLTQPTGDLPDRFALAATAPIPPNPHRPGAVLGAAQGHIRILYGYGRFLVSSGPYMIEGSQDLNLSLPPAEQQPLSGWAEPGHELTLVRNPSWDAATDDLRAAYPDRIEVRAHGEWPSAPHPAVARRFAEAVETGTMDHVLDLDFAAEQIRWYRADPEMQGRVISAPGRFVYFIVLNLAVPPFDDLHVRRSIAFAIDRGATLRAVRSDPSTRLWVEAYQPIVATHIAPDEVEGNLLANYEPYPRSLERARDEMAASHYDRDGDGRCDAPECRAVLALVGEEFGSAGARRVARWLAAIGIELRVREADRGCPVNETKRWPLFMGCGFGTDYPNASTFLPYLFASWEIAGGYGANMSLLGAGRLQLRRWGYDVMEVPSVDDRIDRCMATTGSAQTECWADLDRYLMEEVVPLVPYATTERTMVVSRRVASLSVSVASFGLALDRIALVPGSE